MILLGFTASTLIAILKKTPLLSRKNIFIKPFIMGFFYAAIGYHLNTLLSRTDNLNFLFLNSIFLVICICIFIYTYAEYKKNNEHKIIAKRFLLGFAAHSFLGYLIWPENLNVFWPIKDSELAFSLFNSLLSGDELMYRKVCLAYLSIEFVSLHFYGKFLVSKLLIGSGSAEDISRVSRFLKIQRYVFTAVLFIFFVTYGMQRLDLDVFFIFSSMLYLVILSYCTYVNYKTNFATI